MKDLLFSLFSALTLVFGAAAQNIPIAKKETDRGLRELVGPVHYVRIRRRLITSTDDEGFGGGRLPSLTIYRRSGAISKYVAYDDKGNLDSKSIGKFDASGNKIEEETFWKSEKFPRKRFMAYNAHGNMIENKDYNNYNGVMSQWQKFSYNRRRYVRSIAYLNKEGQILAIGKYLYYLTGRQKLWSSFDASGKLVAKTLYYYHNKNEEIRIYDNSEALTGREVTLVNRHGDQTEVVYDEHDKPLYKSVCSYKRDYHGNWIKEICSEWRGESGQLVFKRTKATWRAITYY